MAAYEATITLKIQASALDEAYRIQQAAARKLRAYVGEDGITAVHTSMLDLEHVRDKAREAHKT